jgi:hypothetical protein
MLDNSSSDAVSKVQRAIDELEQLVENSPAVPLSTKKFVDQEQFFSHIQRLRSVLPKSTQESKPVEVKPPVPVPHFDYKTVSEAMPSFSTLENAADILQNALKSQLVQRELREGWELWQIVPLTGSPQGFVFIFRRPAPRAT